MMNNAALVALVAFAALLLAYRTYGRFIARRVFLQSRVCLPLPSALALRFGYGCHHRLRKARFNFIESAHAGHTGAGRFRLRSFL